LLTRLQRGCEALGLAPDSAQQERLLDYLALLLKWNNAYNLTSVRDPAQMVTRHLLDSLAVAPHLSGEHVIDVGTGAGLPGVPLAIMFPGTRFALLDSNGKKTRFLFQVKTALSLDNIVVHQARVESFQPGSPFVSVISRAFASLQEMVRGCRHLVAPGGRLLAMKGASPGLELQACASERIDAVVHALNVPDLNEQRHVVEIRLQAG